MAERTLVASLGYFLLDSKTGKSHAIFDGMVIGRREGDVVYSGDALLSGRHFKILVRAGGLQIEDLKSTNKTKVNGRTLSPFQPVEIGPGDQIEAGEQSFSITDQASVSQSSVSKDREPTLNSLLFDDPSYAEADPEPSAAAPLPGAGMPPKPVLPPVLPEVPRNLSPQNAAPEPSSAPGPAQPEAQSDFLNDFPEIEVAIEEPEKTGFGAHFGSFIRLRGWHLSTYILLLAAGLLHFAYRAPACGVADGPHPRSLAIAVAVAVFLILTLPFLLLNNFLYLNELKSKVTRTLGAILIATAMLTVAAIHEFFDPHLRLCEQNALASLCSNPVDRMDCQQAIQLQPALFAALPASVMAEIQAGFESSHSHRARAQNQNSQAEPPAQGAVSPAGTSDIESDYNIAVAHFHLGKYDQALEELNRIARMSPGYKDTQKLIQAILARKQPPARKPASRSRPRRR